MSDDRYVDPNGIVWLPPTAEAYALTCAALSAEREKSAHALAIAERWEKNLWQEQQALTAAEAKLSDLQESANAHRDAQMRAEAQVSARDEQIKRASECLESIKSCLDSCKYGESYDWPKWAEEVLVSLATAKPAVPGRQSISKSELASQPDSVSVQVSSKSGEA